jgi:outer membrane receptor for ferrienterochelin and colicins
LTKQFSISAAYQYLETGDKDQLAQIKNGTVYTRDANGLSRKLNVSEYVGLPNNSTHKAQLKFNYSNQNGLFGNIRALYRSKWAVNNTNGNEVFDDGDSFAKGYIALHLSIGKEYVNGIGFQFGCDNMLNYIDALNLPNLPGRTFFATLKIQKSKKI